MINIEDYNFEELDKLAWDNCSECVLGSRICASDESEVFEEEVDAKFGKSLYPACARFKITKKDENSNN